MYIWERDMSTIVLKHKVTSSELLQNLYLCYTKNLYKRYLFLLLWPHYSQEDIGLANNVPPGAPRSEPSVHRFPSTWSSHRIRGLPVGLVTSIFYTLPGLCQDIWIERAFSSLLFIILHSNFYGLAQKCSIFYFERLTVYFHFVLTVSIHLPHLRRVNICTFLFCRIFTTSTLNTKYAPNWANLHDSQTVTNDF